MCVVLAATFADARVVLAPPIQRYCRGPSTWPALAKCVHDHASLTIAARPSATVELINDHGRTYVFLQGRDSKWRLQSQLSGETYELVGRTQVKLGAVTGDRVELRRHFEFTSEAHFTTVFQKLALLCTPEAWCAEYVYGCTVLDRGKAIETFVGEIKIDPDGTPNVVGDRSQSVSICR